MLDIDLGTYPYVTSSAPTAGGACTGSGIPPSRIDQTIGVFKAYTTRVGYGPFPTELLDELGDQIREVGDEYGTITGRARRVGWFDAAVARYSVATNGIDSIVLTKVDVLDEFETLKICTGYLSKGESGTTPWPTSRTSSTASRSTRSGLGGCPRRGNAAASRISHPRAGPTSTGSASCAARPSTWCRSAPTASTPWCAPHCSTERELAAVRLGEAWQGAEGHPLPVRKG